MCFSVSRPFTSCHLLPLEPHSYTEVIPCPPALQYRPVQYCLFPSSSGVAFATTTTIVCPRCNGTRYTINPDPLPPAIGGEPGMNLDRGNNDWQNEWMGLQQGGLPHLPHPIPLPHVAQATFNFGVSQDGTYHPPPQAPNVVPVVPPHEPIPARNANGPPPELENSAQGQAAENGQAPEGGKGRKSNGGSRNFRREA
jgi:hypothetical protein